MPQHPTSLSFHQPQSPDLHRLAAFVCTISYKLAAAYSPKRALSAAIQPALEQSLTARKRASIVGMPRDWADTCFCKGEPPRCIMNLPNSLTILRIFFIPVLVVVLLTRAPNVVFFGVPINFAVWGVLILLAAAATDWADGYYARRRSEVTTLGILLDPIADKLLMSAAFISLVEMHLVQGWMAVIIIGREIVVLGLRNIASAEGFTIPASALGKTKMVLQVIAVCAVILAAKHAVFRPLGVLLLWLVVGV